MRTAGARVLRDDDQEDMSREAVLLQWERKIEAAESRPRRFERDAGEDDEAGEGGTVSELRPTEDATHEAPRKFERRAVELLVEQPIAERRTITITGRPDPQRQSRRSTVMTSPIAQPDRIALWAFLLGLFLVAVAAGTAHA